jgi:thiosulfate dehydrogenase
MKENENNLLVQFKKIINLMSVLLGIIILTMIVLSINYLGFFDGFKSEEAETKIRPYKKENKVWVPISMDAVMHEKNPSEIQYGRDLISNTAYYLGPQGTIAHLTNGMNCQNCHLEAGTKVWGNNYAGVVSTYPKFRERSGTKESIIKRVNDCMERSLNGKGLDSASKEMKAIVSYIKFVGKFVPKDTIPEGAGIWKLKFLKRAADPQKGMIAYQQKCVTCHGKNGEGVKMPNSRVYTYPPLWGSHSYNIGAGLFRLSRFAGYIKTNMPFGTSSYDKPQLTDEEAWDIAAYVNSQPRPTKDLSHDWPKISGKPFDHPFGPFADAFSEQQHKYGPFKPIDDFKKEMKKKKDLEEKLKKQI